MSGAASGGARASALVATLAVVALTAPLVRRSPDALAQPAPHATSTSTAASHPAGSTPSSEASRCPPDMIPVRGDYCPEVRQTCRGWIDFLQRCREFARPTACLAPRRAMDYCIDRYEWPGRAGAFPEVMVSFNDAQALCRSRGRRLCTESEWTFACEGEESLPYPYGYVRDANACVIDHRRRAVRAPMLLRNLPGMLMGEVSRLYEASPSGSAPRCASPFGVMDMTGNVDEWAVNESGVPYPSLLKGGWWSRAKARCRTATRTHYQQFRYYEIGFRCCADPRAG